MVSWFYVRDVRFRVGAKTDPWHHTWTYLAGMKTEEGIGAKMDEAEFRRLLDLFPIIRSRDYHPESEPSQESTSKIGGSEAVKEWQEAWDEGDKKDMEKEPLYLHDAFWEKLKLVTERKVGATEAERFCKAFQRIHKKLVYEELSLDAAQKLLNSS